MEQISQILEKIREDICDNYCKYRDTADEECLCDKIRDGSNCNEDTDCTDQDAPEWDCDLGQSNRYCIKT